MQKERCGTSISQPALGRPSYVYVGHENVWRKEKNGKKERKTTRRMAKEKKVPSLRGNGRVATVRRLSVKIKTAHV